MPSIKYGCKGIKIVVLINMGIVIKYELQGLT
jgi:hypothetical protein